MPEAHNLARHPRRRLDRLVHNPEIVEPAKRFLDLGLAVEMPHGLLKNLHRVKLVVLVEIVRHPAGEPGLRPQQCRFFRKFFPDRTAIFRAVYSRRVYNSV